VATKSVGAAAKGAAARAKYSGSNFEQATFVNRDLTVTEQAQCKEWDTDFAISTDNMDTLTQGGYKFTFRWDEYHNCQACWMLPGKDDPVNTGLILTGRGSTPMKALKQVMFKHFHIFDSSWSRDDDRRGEPEIDD